MAIVGKTGRVCENCGLPIETTASGDLGCMVCLLDVALHAAAADEAESGLAAEPDQLGAYSIEHHTDGSLWELGRGAMGITYRAIDRMLGSKVALKIIKTDGHARNGAGRERFLREARAAAALRHPNIATAYQFGIDEQSGESFYAMELVEGETLEERVRRCGPMQVEAVVEIARQITAALAVAEKRGLIHRDLKPANAMIVSGENEDGLTIKVIDFGLAKALAEAPDARGLTQGGFVGTPAFASPEQLSLKPVDIRSDIYSLGATLWYLLTGHMPFGDRNTALPPPVEQLKGAHVPARLISLLVSMLAREPATRPSVSALTQQLQTIQNRLDARKKLPMWWGIAAALIALAMVAVIWGSRRGPTAPAIPEKSVAVLPFTSFGDEKENAYIADGVQDEILTDLTKVADLKVISRRSVASYRDKKQSVGEIGQVLQVSHVLEGTVRKTDGQIHVTVQLIDTRSGAQTWAETYDREVADIFLIQNDIAQEVVSRLKAELSPREKEAIEAKPTDDFDAYDLYLRARLLVYGQDAKTGKEVEEQANKATELLEQAIARDPKFTLAYCVLADAQLMLDNAAWSWDGRWQKKAKEAIDAALQISPHSAEAHLVRAQYLIERFDDPRSSEKDLAIAAAGLPGRASVFDLRAAAEEQRGQWKEALRDREHAVQLDPRNQGTAGDLIQLLISVRRYPQAERLSDHMIAVLPKEEVLGQYWRLKSHIALARGDSKGAMAALDSSPARHAGLILFNQLVANTFIMQRNYSKAEEFFQSIIGPGKIPYVLPSKGGEAGAQLFSRGAGYERLGRLARFRGERDKAQSYFEAARPNFEQWLSNNHDPGTPRWGRAHAAAYLAQIDAGLGRKDEAIREGRKVVEFWSMQRDARIAPDMKIRLAIVYLWSAEREAALQQLSEVVKVPAWPPVPPFCPGMSAGDLKLNPLWDELRDDPRFQKLIAEAAKPVSL